MSDIEVIKYIKQYDVLYCLFKIILAIESKFKDKPEKFEKVKSVKKTIKSVFKKNNFTIRYDGEIFKGLEIIGFMIGEDSNLDELKLFSKFLSDFSMDIFDKTGIIISTLAYPEGDHCILLVGISSNSTVNESLELLENDTKILKDFVKNYY